LLKRAEISSCYLEVTKVNKKTYDEVCDLFNPPSQQTFLNQSFDFSVEMLNKYKVSDLDSLMGTAYGLVV
jgi:hypothetical protein